MRNFEDMKKTIIAMMLTFSLTGCGVTVATVAGVGAYEMYSSGGKAEDIQKDLNNHFADSYFAVAALDKNVVIAGQVKDQNDIAKAKDLINKDYDDYTVYSYLVEAEPEQKSQQEADKEISKKITEFIQENKYKGLTNTVANNHVYLLTNNKQEKQTLTNLSEKILKLNYVKQVTVIEAR